MSPTPTTTRHTSRISSRLELFFASLSIKMQSLPRWRFQSVYSLTARIFTQGCKLDANCVSDANVIRPMSVSTVYSCIFALTTLKTDYRIDIMKLKQN